MSSFPELRCSVYKEDEDQVNHQCSVESRSLVFCNPAGVSHKRDSWTRGPVHHGTVGLLPRLLDPIHLANLVPR
ncbi:hypothetical protein Pcinc_011876 [Petrolisthes cinctipes]|uniref:Uncharacterized protein n=1 Tax=Petrolisthes cinctipes TaxID=88211 RepID=A0AAE1FZZ4_PETCI|nr:hypothetical protein Pcinc_011876 [Petrolisthes cinctipes]